MAEVINFEKREKPKPAKAATPPSTRFEALDILRGLFMIGMLLANNAGDWTHIYTQFDHAEWHGFTMTDMVFPGFMVCVGLSMTLSLGRRMKAGGKQAMAIHALRRAAIIVGIGLFLNLLPNFDFAHWRLPGVLQRIGVCYGLASGLVLLHSHVSADGKLVLHARALAIWAIGLLAGYAILMKFIPVPGFGADHFDAVQSWPAYIDRIVFGADHIYADGKTYDPEGLVSTFPAIANILGGILVGLYINDKGPKNASVGVAMIGLMLLVLGFGLDSQIPIIKKMWTSSFVLVTVGFASLLLSLLMLIMDKLGYTKWAFPIRVFGTNAILAYVAAWLLSVFTDVTGIGGAITTWMHGVITDPYLMSITYAIGFLVVIWLFLLPFYLKKIFIKV